MYVCVYGMCASIHALIFCLFSLMYFESMYKSNQLLDHDLSSLGINKYLFDYCTNMKNVTWYCVILIFECSRR